MKRIILYSIIALGLASMVASCTGNGNTITVKPGEPTIVPTTEQEIYDVVTSLMASDSMPQYMSADLASLSAEARDLIAGNAEGNPYVPFDWNVKTLPDASHPGQNNIDEITVTPDSVTVTMTHRGKNGLTSYVLIMRHEKGRWLIDDVRWPGQQPPFDTERHALSAYMTDAIDNLTGGDANYIVETRIVPLMPDYSNDESAAYYDAHPQAVERVRAVILTAKHYLEQNRSYTTPIADRLNSMLATIDNHTEQ